MMATTEPTPLYAFWERSYGFGAIVTSLVFATYAVGVIAALLFAGRDWPRAWTLPLPDHAGARVGPRAASPPPSAPPDPAVRPERAFRRQTRAFTRAAAPARRRPAAAARPRRWPSWPGARRSARRNRRPRRRPAR